MRTFNINKFEGLDSLKIDIERIFKYYEPQRARECILSFSKTAKEKFLFAIDKYPGIFTWLSDKSCMLGPLNSKLYIL